MEIRSVDGLSYIALEYLDATPDLPPDIKISVRVAHHSFSGHSERVWVSRRQIDNFIDTLERLRCGQRGKAFLASLGFPADGMYLELFEIAEDGRLAIKVNVHEIEYFSNETISHLKVNVGFNLAAKDLPQVIADLRSVFLSEGDRESAADETDLRAEG